MVHLTCTILCSVPFVILSWHTPRVQKVVENLAAVRDVVPEDHAHSERVVVDSEVARGNMKEEVEVIGGTLDAYK